MDELLKELEQIEQRMANPAEGDDVDALTKRANELMAQIGEQREAENATAQQRQQTLTAVRAAIAAGEARSIPVAPVPATAGVAEPTQARSGIAYDRTDYTAAERRGWVKHVARQSGIQLVGGTEMTEPEQRAFVHMVEDGDADAVVPVSVQNTIIDMIESSTAFHSDLTVDHMRHLYEIPRSTGITAGDAALTDEGLANDDESLTFDRIGLTGYEFKKTAKLSRKMAVQSLDGFEQWLVREIASRMGNALDLYDLEQLEGEQLGMASANKLTTATAGTLTMADVRRMFASVRLINNQMGAAKGRRMYASAATIWNHLAALNDGNGRAYFIPSEYDSDPLMAGRIYGVPVKEEPNIPDGVIIMGYPGAMMANLFDGIDINPFVENGTQVHCYTGYALYDSGLAVPTAFAKLSIGEADIEPKRVPRKTQRGIEFQYQVDPYHTMTDKYLYLPLDRNPETIKDVVYTSSDDELVAIVDADDDENVTDDDGVCVKTNSTKEGTATITATAKYRGKTYTDTIGVDVVLAD